MIVLLLAAVVVGVGGGAALAGALATANPGSSRAPAGSAVAVVPSGSPGAGSVPPAPTATPTPTPEPTPVLVPAPLTGLPVSPDAALQHPIAVMVDDHVGARPQSGFNSAAIVWQAPAEGGIPRYMMVFQNALPSAIGPIRSAREYFIEWAAELRAVYTHIGGSPQALATLAAKGRGQLVYNVDGLRFDGSDMWRVTFRQAPHNLYSDGTHLRRMATIVGATDGPVSPTWSFGPAPSMEARPSGTTIVVDYPYERITYRYDAVTNTYRRYINASKTPQVDAADGREVRPTNVVVLRMFFGPLNDGHPLKGRLEAQDVGSGQAIVSTGGRVIVGTWTKASVSAPTQLLDVDGHPITLGAGQTFVQVLALSYPYQITEGSLPRDGIRVR